MIIDLEREDIVKLLRKQSPNFDVMDKIPHDLGGFHAFYYTFVWADFDYILNSNHTDEELYDLYILCKTSWGK